MKAVRTARVILPIVVLALGVAAARFMVSLRSAPATDPTETVLPMVEVVTVERSTVEITVEAQGTVVPRTQSRLVAEVSGTVTSISPRLVNGGFFEEGETLLTLDTTDYQLTLQEARLAVAQAELQEAQEEADAEVARNDWERMGRDEPRPLAVREPQLAEARARVRAALARLEKARVDIERCTIRAPYAGRVRSQSVDRGQFVTRGEELARVYAVDYAEVRLPLADKELAFLDLPLSYRGAEQGAEDDGLPVTLRARFAGREHVWNGRIVRTEGELDPASRMVIAIARVENPYGRGREEGRPPLAIGMFVTAEIRGRRFPDVRSLPRPALRGGGSAYVFEGTGDGGEGRLRIRQVSVLRAESDHVVLDGGLDPGELVITSPLEAVVDGMGVRLFQPGASTGASR